MTSRILFLDDSLDALRMRWWRVKRWLASFERHEYPPAPWHAAWFQRFP